MSLIVPACRVAARGKEPTLVPHSLTWQVGSRDGLTIVTVSGTVDPRSGPALYRVLTQCLQREPRAVVVEMTAATVTDPRAAAAFASIVQQSRLWPGTPVLLCTPDTSTAGMVAAQAGEPLPWYATVADALATLPGGDDVISEVMQPIKGAARRARGIVTEACLRWEFPHLVAPAALVVSELVTNAVIHAHTVMTLQVRLRPRYLYLAVFDGAHTEPVPRHNQDADTAGGRGLHLIDMAAVRWGHRWQHDGKVVWACFLTSPDAQVSNRPPDHGVDDEG